MLSPHANPVSTDGHPELSPSGPLSAYYAVLVKGSPELCTQDEHPEEHHEANWLSLVPLAALLTTSLSLSRVVTANYSLLIYVL